MFINSYLPKFILSTVFVVLATSSSAAPQPAPSSVAESQVESKQPVSGPQSSLSADIIFNVLMGEIALQRDDLELAYKHQLRSADLANDAVAAERAAKIALHKKDQVGALKAVKRWIELDPKSARAKQMVVMLYVRSGNAEAALRHLKLLVKLHEKDGQDGFVQAMVAVASGKDNDLALKLMQSLVQEYKSSANARYAVALIAVMAKKLDVAESEVRQTLSIDPKMEKAHVLLGRIYAERGDADGAMSAMGQALQLIPKSKSLHTAYARLLVDLNKPELAYQQFQQLQQLAPEDVDVQFSLGILALELKKYQQAKSHFSGLLKSQQRVEDASFYMGRVAEMEEKTDGALEWYGKVRSGKYLFNARARMVGLIADKESLAKARAMLEGMRTRMPERSIDIYILEGDILRKHSTHTKVVELFDAALKEHPDDIDLLYARALSASALGRVDILERDIGLILKQEPNHADALNALGYTLADQTERYKEAHDYIKKALALKPDSPAVLDSMGWVQYRLGNNKEALDYLRRAFKMVQDVEIAAHLGELLWVTGKKQEAQKIIQDALQKHPDNEYLLKTVKRLGI
jgi:tetratricopeptide (TPR) repeat protein